MNLHFTLAFTWSLVAAAPGLAQSANPGLPGTRAETVVLATGTGPDACSIQRVVLGAPAIAPVTALQNVEFLPIDLAQRTTLQEFAPQRGRIVELGMGVLALELPGPGAARVLHYRRGGTTTFGFASITSAGEVRVLVEQTGLGPNQTLDPFATIVAAAPDGHTVAIAGAKYNSGIDEPGDAWLAKADGPAFAGGALAVELTAGLEWDVAPHSLVFKGDWLYAVVEDGLGRAPRDGSGPFAPVAIPPSGGLAQPDVSDEFAVSGDGSTIVFLAGVDEANVDLYVIDANDVVTNVTQAPSEIQPPNYLPSEAGGPLLALSHDGAFVLFDREFAHGHEAFLRATTPGAIETHLTGDADFEHSIDTVSGVLFGAGRARFFADSGLANADLYQVDLATPGAVKNVSQTSGVAEPFFPNAGQIGVAAAHALGVEQSFVNDQTAAGGAIDLWRVDANDVATLVAPQLASPPEIVAPKGARSHFVVRAEAAAHATLFVSIPNAGVFAPVLHVPASIALGSVATNAAGTRVALAADAFGARWVAQMHPGTGHVALVGAGPMPGASELQYSARGRLLLVADAAGGMRQAIAADATSGVATHVGSPAPFSLWLR